MGKFTSFPDKGREHPKRDEQRSLSGALDRARRQEENTIEYCLNGVTNSIKCSDVIQVDEYSS